MDNEPRFPGIELSNELRQKIHNVTTRGVVNKLVLVVSKEAFDKGDQEAIYAPGYEAENYSEIAEWISRSTVVCTSGSAGTGLGLSFASDMEVVILGYTGLSKKVSDSYAAYLKDLGIQVDATHVAIEPFFTVDISSMPQQNTYAIAEWKPEQEIRNLGTLTTLLMADPIWGDSRVLESVKRNTLDAETLLKLSIYSAVSDREWNVALSAGQDRAKYGVGGNRAIMNCFLMAACILGNRSFFSSPTNMLNDMVSHGLIDKTQQDSLAQALSDMVLERTLVRGAAKKPNRVFGSIQESAMAIPSEFLDPDFRKRRIRDDRKHVIQTYYELRDRVLSPLGFPGREAVDFKSLSPDKQLDLILKRDTSNRKGLALAAIWLTKSAEVLASIYGMYPQEWLAGLAVAKFKPVAAQTERDIHAQTIFQVEKTNDTFWKDEYLAKIAKKAELKLGYT